ncbi:MAG: ABC transporter ATP-binding protein [Chloroflexi bacterium]|uniref:ABC transporter ATP-binding protein n=1 Tax=Candidatus Flexifilum breve TaxID=3140694 RepID=UPI003137565C|nr:ABC transporter ATP-binding protein [Chloroflexota bacterium]
MTPIIQAEHLYLDYKLNDRWVNALHDVSLTINPLEIHGLVGESGSGKSTLALALMRYLAPNARISEGTLTFDGNDLRAKAPKDMRAIWGREMSLVPQDSLAALNPSHRVGDQIADVFRLHEQLSAKDAHDRAVEMLRRVKIADPVGTAKRYPHQLSGGMQQRITIAMALSTRPRLLVLDEPTTALDVTTQAVIIDLFRDLIHDNQAAALYVSHNLGLVAQLCDRVTVLYSSEVMASAPVKEIFTRPIHPYTISLLASLPRLTQGTETRLPTIEGTAPSLAERPRGCVFASRCPVALPLCHAEKPPLEQIDDGRWVKCHRWREIASGELAIETAPKADTVAAPPRDTYVLTANDMHKTFGAPSLLDRLTMRQPKVVRAVDNVSLRLLERSTLGLVGESGSGKTTLARLIVGLESADRGHMELLNLPLPNALDQRTPELLRSLQMIFQNPNDTLNPYQTVGAQIARTIKRLGDKSPSKAAIKAQVADLLQAVRLPADYANRYANELSGGEKQRVAIARAFSTHPALVLADEPTSSLDVSVQSVILNLLKDLRAQQGASYLLISHDLNVVSYLADWIAVMYLGEVVEEGPPATVYTAPSHPYTEALVSAIPNPDPTAQDKRIRLEGDLPVDLPTGCRFHTRCPRKLGAICETEAPPNRDAGDGHMIRCHIPVDELVRLQQSPPEKP